MKDGDKRGSPRDRTSSGEASLPQYMVWLRYICIGYGFHLYNIVHTGLKLHPALVDWHHLKTVMKGYVA